MLATDTANPSTSPPANPHPRPIPNAIPSSVATKIWPTAPGTATFRTASRSLIEKWIPTPNIRRIPPISASSAAVPVSATIPGVNGPMVTPASR